MDLYEAGQTLETGLTQVQQAEKLRETEAEVWAEFDGNPEPDFFRDISIAKDGGFSEVADLWYPMRWITAIITLIFLAQNLYYNLRIDYEVINRVMHSSEKDDGPVLMWGYIGNAVMRCLGIEYPIGGYAWVAAIELILMSILILFTIVCTVRACRTRSAHLRWAAWETVWWLLIPDLYTYSAMRLLHYVSPQVLMAEISKQTSDPSTKEILKFVFSRVVFFITGFDAFMLKCSESKRFMEEGLTPREMLDGIIFLKQVLGIVQLGMFVRDRLFLFIFAGEDGIMQRREQALQNVWNAMLVREIWRTFSLAKFVVIMLSFDDTDFQRLVLNEKRRLLMVESSSTSCSEDAEDGKP
uniref:Uncharacterized protein n=1 Tax=Pyrodinium bahamense TaxID=73915 RepID=A0A7S0F8S2_9DINO|mmetsp:Transcript_12814/g.35460  ORF Transcript_12814/g.35460 Transcript_12814/m.35460 type:complete len:355 (+) Transcript_12814:91-1155(+)